MAIVTPTYRPIAKSIRNHCVIEVFGGVLCCELVVELSVGIKAFVINWVRSFSFFLYVTNYKLMYLYIHLLNDANFRKFPVFVVMGLQPKLGVKIQLAQQLP